MVKMIISGNQTAIAEIMQKLDKDFVPPFVCKCGDKSTHKLICGYQDKQMEETFGCSYFEYEIDYDGEHIKSVKLLYKGHSNGNILDGTVK